MVVWWWYIFRECMLSRGLTKEAPQIDLVFVKCHIGAPDTYILQNSTDFRMRLVPLSGIIQNSTNTGLSIFYDPAGFISRRWQSTLDVVHRKPLYYMLQRSMSGVKFNVASLRYTSSTKSPDVQHNSIKCIQQIKLLGRPLRFRRQSLHCHFLDCALLPRHWSDAAEQTV